MLVNNPMGSRRRRRFYHRAGIVPGPGGRFKTGFPELTFFRFEPELHVQEEVEEQIEEREYHLIPRINQGEQEDRANAKLNNSRNATDEDIGQPAAAASATEQRAAPDFDQTDAPAVGEPTRVATKQPSALTAEQPFAPAAKQPIAPADEQSTAPGAKQLEATDADIGVVKEIIIDSDGAQSSN